MPYISLQFASPSRFNLTGVSSKVLYSAKIMKNGRAPTLYYFGAGVKASETPVKFYNYRYHIIRKNRHGPYLRVTDKF